jgi:Ca2+-binding RTX toxin-like protein
LVGADDDDLDGGNGDDTLYAKGGQTLTGGEGADLF